jgi:hypothetical protein
VADSHVPSAKYLSALIIFDRTDFLHNIFILLQKFIKVVERVLSSWYREYK